MTTEQIYNTVNETVSELIKMRFICFPFVLLPIEGEVKMATFISTYTERRREGSVINRPKRWVIVNPNTGDIESIHNCKDIDFTDADYRAEYPYSYNELDYKFEEFDEIRLAICNNADYTVRYHQYIENIVSQIAGYSKFVFDLSGIDISDSSTISCQHSSSSIKVDASAEDFSTPDSASIVLPPVPMPLASNVVIPTNAHTEWTFKNGLRYVPEEVYNYALTLVDKGLVFVDLDNTQASGDMVYIINHTTLCKDVSFLGMQDILKRTENGTIIRPESEFSYGIKRVRDDFVVESACDTKSCTCLTCPLHCAGAISYLQQKGELERLVDDRHYYKDHEDEILNMLSQDAYLFNFIWTPEQQLDDISLELFKNASSLYQRGFVKVLPDLSADGYVQIVSTVNPKDFDRVEDMLEFSQTQPLCSMYLVNGDNGILSMNDNVFSDDLIKTAAYLYYLKMTGRYNDIVAAYRSIQNKSNTNPAFNIIKEIRGTDEESLYCIVNQQNKSRVIQKLIDLIESHDDFALMVHLIE